MTEESLAMVDADRCRGDLRWVDSRGSEFVPMSEGASLWTTSRPGAGPTAMVLVHGGPGMFDYLAPVADLLPSLTTHRYDQRGCGRSSAGTSPGTDCSMDRYVADLEELRVHFGHDRWAVFGHSFGAVLAVAYAARHPERVQALVYCGGTGLNWPAHRAQYRARAGARLTAGQSRELAALTGRSRSRQEEVRWRMLSWLLDFAPGAGAEGRAWAAASVDLPLNLVCNRLLNAETDGWSAADQRAQCAAVTAPVLAVHGEQDPRPVAPVHNLVQALPRAWLAVVPGAGHQPWVERPGEFADLVRTFLRA